MKKKTQLICILCLYTGFSLSACTGGPIVETDMTPREIARAIIESQEEMPELNEVTENDEFKIWTTNYYLINSESVTGGAIYYAEGAEVSEISVLVLTDTKAASAAETALTEYIANRAELFGYYEPHQAAIARSSIAVANGNYVALLICEDTAAAKTAFLNCFGKPDSGKQEGNGNSGYPSSDASHSGDYDHNSSFPAIEEEYSEFAILQAFKSGDDTVLSEKNKRILDAAISVISQYIAENMSDYQKELAIHDYITSWSDFDWSVLGHGNIAEDSRTPYGVLIDRKAMCHGFSSTFQLFMKMLDIECVTVFSTSNGSIPHSWNVVKIENDWYCVDAAWDTTSGHEYFNVTSQYLRSRGYRWDESTVPEATGTKYAYKG